MNYYVHNTPGRLRVKIPSMKGSPKFANDVEGILRTIEGIDSTAVNTLTGSIVINYDRKIVSSEAVLSVLEKRGYFETPRAVSNDRYLDAVVSKAGGVVGKVVLEVLLATAFEGSALSLLTVLI